MTISGFTFVKNATKLYYPVRATIESALPVVDQFVVALGDCDEDDNTRQVIEEIDSSKIKIIDTVWDTNAYPNATEYAHQTDIAKNACTGDWCFYLQADEVIHEKYLAEVKDNCRKYLRDEAVEGFLFKYKHFWGDFDHYLISHAWYSHEIRIVRNDPGIHSFGDAQSFRRFPHFDGKSYRDRENSHKLKVVELDACIYHYGFVRPPRLMQQKSMNMDAMYHDAAAVQEMYERAAVDFDYGNVEQLPEFTGTHPKVMQQWIAQSNWQEEMEAARRHSTRKKKHRHEKLKNRLLTFIEQNLLGGKRLFGHQNWIKLKR